MQPSHPKATSCCGDAVDVKALTDERRLSRTAKSCGPGAPMQALSSADVDPQDDGGKGWFTEESAYKP